MTITVSMSKEEFLDYNKYKEFKNNLKCGIIELNDCVNALMKEMLEDGIWVDKNKYDKLLHKINSSISSIEGGVKDVDTEM